MTDNSKYTCCDCGKIVHRPETKRCRKCADKCRTPRIDPLIKMENRRKYKADYYQRNKKRIDKRNEEYRINNPEKINQQRLKYYLRSKLGLEIEDYEFMLNQHNFQCAICGYKQPENANKYEKLYVDHNHTTGKIRGLLCMNCNSALGHFGENLTNLKNAVTYLTKYEPLSSNNTENFGNSTA